MVVQEAANATSSGNLHKQDKVQKLHYFACDFILLFELFVSLDCEKRVLFEMAIWKDRKKLSFQY